MRKAALGTCLAAMAWCAPAARGSMLYASANESPGPSLHENIYTINQTSGAAGLLGNSMVAAPIDLASDWRPGSFRLWAVDSIESGPNRLVSIDPATGMGTVVGNFGTSDRMQSIAFDVVTGKLYGTTATFDRLYEINPDTAAPTFIGDIAAEGILALGFDLTGALYGVADETHQLVRINIATAASTSIGLVNLAYLNDLAVRPEDGAMFAVSADTDAIYTINLTNASTTLVGPYDQGLTYIDGLAFGPIPEPATILLLVAGSLGLMRRRRDSQAQPRLAEDRDHSTSINSYPAFFMPNRPYVRRAR